MGVRSNPLPTQPKGHYDQILTDLINRIAPIYLNPLHWVLPSCIIFKGKVHIEGWYQDHTLPPDWRVEVSQNGWTTDEIGLRWLQKVFIPATTSRTVGRYRLLILDGHGSHLTPGFDKACRDNDIIAICMPAHSSHLLQPLDVGCFAL
jgi:hypothetical protein